MLTKIKLALRITSTTFDDEIQLYIDSCLAEMTALGVIGAIGTSKDPQIIEAVISYCKWKFGDNENKAEWEAIYHQKLAQLKTMTGHTKW